MLVLAYHHPLAIVKRYGTLDLLSGGRLILGVGVGSLREEFDLLGAGFEGRGRRADADLGVLRAAFGQREVDGFVVDPSGVQHPPPIWVGGRSVRSLRRAVELGDGWVPFGLGTDQVRAMLDWARGSEAWERRAQALEIVLWPEPPIDPIGDPAGAERAIAAAVEAGATIVNLRFRSRSLAHHLEQMEAVAAFG